MQLKRAPVHFSKDTKVPLIQGEDVSDAVAFCQMHETRIGEIKTLIVKSSEYPCDSRRILRPQGQQFHAS